MTRIFVRPENQFAFIGGKLLQKSLIPGPQIPVLPLFPQISIKHLKMQLIYSGNSLHPEQESDDHFHSLQFPSKLMRMQLNLDGKRLPVKNICII